MTATAAITAYCLFFLTAKSLNVWLGRRLAQDRANLEDAIASADDELARWRDG